MQIGVVGLGRMGGNIVRRLMKKQHRCVVFDQNAAAIAPLKNDGASAATNLENLARQLDRPRAVWVMLPAGDPTEQTVMALAGAMERDDIIIDGGNSYFKDDIRRAEALKTYGIRYVDVGTSGGVWGLERGYCLMIGGEEDIVKHLAPIFSVLAPGVNAAPRTPGREKLDGTAEYGWSLGRT